MDCATDFPGRYHNIGMKLNLKDTHVFGLYVFLHSLSQCYQISQDTLLRLIKMVTYMCQLKHHLIYSSALKESLWPTIS